MINYTRITPALALLTLFIHLITGCRSGDRQPDSGRIEIRKAWARPAAKGATGGAYLTIFNGTGRTERLIGISSDASESTGIHESYRNKDGMSGMRPAGELPIEAGSKLVMKPGGYHIMMMKLKRDLQIGDSVSVRLMFAGYDTLQVYIPVGLHQYSPDP